jgi:hypothetical protein
LIWSLDRRVEARSMLTLVCVVNGHSIPLNVWIRLVDQVFSETDLLHNLWVSVEAKCLALVVLFVSIAKVCWWLLEWDSCGLHAVILLGRSLRLT